MKALLHHTRQTTASSSSKRLPGDGNVDLLPGHGVTDGPCEDPGLVRGEVLGVRVSVQVPGDHVGLDAGHVHLSNVLAIRGSCSVVAIPPLVEVLQKRQRDIVSILLQSVKLILMSTQTVPSLVEVLRVHAIHQHATPTMHARHIETNQPCEASPAPWGCCSAQHCPGARS
jgi:hypothetical protein